MTTAKDLFDRYSILYQFEEGSPEYLIDKEDFNTALIEFAKLHVQYIKELQHAKWIAGETGYIKTDEWEDIIKNIK